MAAPANTSVALLGSAPKRRGQVKKRPVKEASIEARFVEEVKKLGCKTRKLNGLGANDWPDRLVMIPGTPGAFITIEFKRPEVRNKPHGGLSPGQVDWHADALRMGFLGQCSVCYDWQSAIDIVRLVMKKSS